MLHSDVDYQQSRHLADNDVPDDFLSVHVQMPNLLTWYTRNVVLSTLPDHNSLLFVNETTAVPDGVSFCLYSLGLNITCFEVSGLGQITQISG